jgi:hypothetical protein
MNQRIEHCLYQAGLTAQGCWDELDDYARQGIEKFAQLIVQECAVYCEGHILPKGMAEENDLNYNDGVMDCAIGLKQHFGVE